MKTITLSLLVAAGILSAGAAQAADEEALAKSKNCMACHAVDKKLVGPAYKDVAKKYAGQKDAEAKLSEKVIKGGKGVWGEIPMPPNTTVTPAESTKLVKWILSLK
ncbi:MAG: c-type cytochrome [Propionivibrio sp.]|jgi:cytochrome c|uniref:C-type cytochrome n=1 Tax=Candidatus Propionivibrio dominans TaxID=2954373 RepID=A0A9D7FA94_9RHOO|nr:c-type cytochrome [Candidatus Propionivibrio dominans]